MASPSLLIRKATVARLKANAGVIAIVPAVRVFGPRVIQKNLVWPFMRVGVSIASPMLASCLDGETIRFAVHGFSKANDEGEAANINAAVKNSLDGATLSLSDGGRAILTWTGAQIMEDGSEADAWHGFSSYEAAYLPYAPAS